MLTDAVRTDAAAVDAALERLAAWSLITWTVDGMVVQAHRLVMRVVRERTSAERAVLRTYREVSRGVKGEIIRFWAEGEHNIWTHSAMMPEYLNQISALRVHLNVDGLRSPLKQFIDADLVISERLAGEHLAKISDISRAIPLLERTVAHWEKRRGLDHPRTLKARSILATAYLEARRYDEAITLHQQILAERQRHSRKNWFTIEARRNLGMAYQKARRLNEAISLYEQIIHDGERRYGPIFMDTKSLYYLAAAYREAGRSGEAFALYEQVLGRSQAPDLVLRSRRCLSGGLARSEAIALYEQALAAKDAPGRDNFDTGTVGL